jgi:hypothetical protein
MEHKNSIRTRLWQIVRRLPPLQELKRENDLLSPALSSSEEEREKAAPLPWAEGEASPVFREIVAALLKAKRKDFA